MDKTIIFWDTDDVEYLTHTEQDDAIESLLDGVGDIDKLPETLEIYGYARQLPKVNTWAVNILDRFLENLDEEYGNPDGNYTESTDSMKEAAEKFVTTVLDDYVSWVCDIVAHKTINVKEWIQKNRPDWLEENSDGVTNA